MHCNLQTSLRSDAVRKQKALTLLPLIKLLSTLPAPHSSCSPALCYPLHLLLSTPFYLLFMDMPACASTLHQVCYYSTDSM